MIQSLHHPTSIISPKAELGVNVRVGAFSIIEDDVVIGDNTDIRPHAILCNGARIGSSCTIHPGAVIAGEPQDLKYRGEPTLAIIGDRTVVREFVTINRGTSNTGKATVGDDCLIMAYSHVAHDCTVGNNAILSNATQLAGHVVIGDWAILGGMSKVIQFCTVGKHSMIGADVKITKDVPPFSLVGRDPARLEGINKIGLRRRGFTSDAIDELDAFFSVALMGTLNTADGIDFYLRNISEQKILVAEVAECIKAIRESKKGVLRG